MMEVDDTESTADGGAVGGGEVGCEVSCSICLEVVTDDGERSWAKLKCGHRFHLDCIGSAFNAKEAMQCPNCRIIEDGQWLFANGSQPHPPETNVDDLSNDHVDIYDIEVGEPYSEPYWWLPSSESQSHQDPVSSEEQENPLLELIDFLGEHTMTEVSSPTLPGPFIEQIGPLHTPGYHWLGTPAELMDDMPTIPSSPLRNQAPLFSWSNYRSYDEQDHSPSNNQWPSFLNYEILRSEVLADFPLGGGGQSNVTEYGNPALQSIPGLANTVQGLVHQDPSNTLSFYEQGLFYTFRPRPGGFSQASVASSSSAAWVPTAHRYHHFLANRHRGYDSPMPDFDSSYHPSSRNPYHQFLANRNSRWGSEDTPPPIRDHYLNYAANQREIMPTSDSSRHASALGLRSRGPNRPGRSASVESQSQLDLHL